MPNKEQRHPDPQQARVETPESGWWLTAAAFVLAAAVYLAPQLAAIKFWWRILIVLGSFLLLLLCLWLRKIALAVRHRLGLSRAYGSLYEDRRELQRENAGLRTAVVKLVSPGSMFNPLRMYLLGDKVHLEFERPPGRPLALPCQVLLVDLSDGFVFGRFDVLETRPRVYQAVESDHVDPVFRRHLASSTSDAPPPGTFVVPVPSTEVE